MRFTPVLFAGVAAAGLVQRGNYDAPPVVDTYAPVAGPSSEPAQEPTATVDVPGAGYSDPAVPDVPGSSAPPTFQTEPPVVDTETPAAGTDYAGPAISTGIVPPPVVSTPTPGGGGHPNNGTGTGSSTRYVPPPSTQTPSPGNETPSGATQVQASVMALLGLVAVGVFAL